MSIPFEAAMSAEPSSRGTDEHHLYQSYLREYNRRSCRNIRELGKYCRKIHQFCSLAFGAYIINIDLNAGTDDEDGNGDGKRENRTGGRWYIDKWLPRPLARTTWRRNLKFGWIPMAVLVFYLIVMTILWTDATYLYKYEINRMRLKRVQTLIREYGPGKQVAIHQQLIAIDLVASHAGKLMSRSANGNSIPTADDRVTHSGSEIFMSLGRFGSILEARLDELRLALAYLGDKFIAWGFINHCAYLAAISLGCAIYLIFFWLYLFVRRYDCQFHRDQIDPGAEELRVDAACRTQVLRYLESSRVHATIDQASRRSCPVLVGTEQSSLSQRRRRKSSNQPVSLPASDLYELDNQHLTVVTNNHLQRADQASDALARRLLMQMLASGALRPLNRCELWRQLRDIMHAFLYLNCIFYAVLFDSCNLYALYQLASPRFDPSELCLLCILMIAGFGFIFHFTTIILSSLEQSLLVRHVLRRIRECIQLNERELLLINDLNQMQDQTSACVACIERVNSNYLFVLMTYKMFVAQFKSFKHANRGLFLVVACGLFVMPLLARIHLPYLGQGALDFRLAFVILSVYSLLPLSAMGLPMCYLHARCQELYIGLSSLLAHITEVRRAEEINGAGTQIYNEHAVTVLMKELLNPEQMLEQFTVESFGLQATFSDLVRLHFWWGLVVLSVLLSTRSEYQDQLFGLYSSDPLGVWCFRLV